MKNVSGLDQNAFCLSINPRRFEYMCKNFNAVGLKSPTLFEGIRWSGGTNTGCVLGHVCMLNMCKNLDLPYCIIYEDDAYPRPDVIRKFEEIKKYVPEDCGILKIGSSSYRGDIEEINKCIYKMKTGTAYGSHAYIVKREAYDKLIEMMSKLNVPDVSMNWDYYADTLKPYVLNFENQLFIQKNISMDNIISNKGGQRYWYPDEKLHVGCTGSIPCRNFVDRLIDDEDDYVETLSIIYNKNWKKGRKTGKVTDTTIETKEESGKLTLMKDRIWKIDWNTDKKFTYREYLVFLKELNNIKHYRIERVD